MSGPPLHPEMFQKARFYTLNFSTYIDGLGKVGVNNIVVNINGCDRHDPTYQQEEESWAAGGKCQPALLTPTDMDNTNTLKHILIISTCCKCSGQRTLTIHGQCRTISFMEY